MQLATFSFLYLHIWSQISLLLQCLALSSLEHRLLFALLPLLLVTPHPLRLHTHIIPAPPRSLLNRPSNLGLSFFSGFLAFLYRLRLEHQEASCSLN